MSAILGSLVGPVTGLLDKFIEDKLRKAGHSLSEQNKFNVILNPAKETIIQNGQGALILK